MKLTPLSRLLVAIRRRLPRRPDLTTPSRQAPWRPVAWIMFTAAAIVSMVAPTLALFPTSTGAAIATSPYPVYSDTLRWTNWSWKTAINWAVTNPRYSGSNAMSVTYTAAWGGFLAHTAGLSTAPYSTLQFAILPSSRGLSAINVSLYDTAGNLLKVVTPQGYATLAGNGWYWVSIPLSDLGAANTTITAVQLQDNTGGAQPTYYLDQVQFAPATPPAPAPSPSPSAAPSPSPTPAPAGALSVYSDALRWTNWSWNSAIDWAVTNPRYSGSNAMSVTYTAAWGGFLAHTAGGLSTAPYSSLQFAVLPSSRGLSAINVSLYDTAGNLLKVVTPQGYATPAGNGWYWVSIPLSDLGAANTTITAVQLQDNTGGAQPIYYLDQVQFTPASAPAPSPTPSPSPTPAPLPSSTPIPSPSATPRPTANPSTGSFKPAQCSASVDTVIRAQAARYNLPRWFYYAVIQRESSCDPSALNASNNGQGLTQLTGSWYNGQLYPENLSAPDDYHTQYKYDMNFPKFGMWLRMTQVTPLTNGFDAQQNLDRFSTGYAVQAFILYKKVYGLNDTDTLRAVAYHWNKGVYVTYDPNNANYLALYDQYVSEFKSAVEREDGIWNGQPALP